MCDHDNDSLTFKDDGGASKSGRRRQIRRVHQIRKFVMAVCALLFVRLMLSSGGHGNARSESRLAHSLALKHDIIQREMLKAQHKNRPPTDDEKHDHSNIVASDTVEQPRVRHDEHFRWADPSMLPPVPGSHEKDIMAETMKKAIAILAVDDDTAKRARRAGFREFKVKYGGKVFEWESEADDEVSGHHDGPAVDYTSLKYEYPELVTEPPPMGQYPPLELLGNLMERWPQDDLDHPPQPFVEKLLHFDYMNEEQLAAAVKFRDLELPFKVYNVPPLDAATLKWTDQYVAENFDEGSASGRAQESVDNFFSFFRPSNWVIKVMGPPPTLDNDLTFEKWAKHARYADSIGLHPSEQHFYWQSGAAKRERSFISDDLHFFSCRKANFFVFDPGENKGIQCRFGERGVTAATHYDAGRNMIAMVTGAKRYILAPPKACTKLGIIADQNHPAFRHSLLNFGHLNALKDTDAVRDMSPLEKEWLEVAHDSLSVETVLKAGEVLYIPSHWFHYITSLQKSAQCNTRSGREYDGSKEFGGYEDVESCVAT